MDHRRFFPKAMCLLIGSSVLALSSCSDSSGPSDDGGDPPANGAPVAAFTHSPGTGTRDTLFVFDATPSTDPDDALEDLEVRWDLDGDGMYDTDWSADKDTTYLFPAAGTYVVVLEVRDPGGLSSTAEETLRVDYTWTAVVSGTFNDLYGVWGTSSSDVFAAGSAGTILHHNGTLWETMSSGTFNGMYEVWGVSSAKAWVAGFQGVARYYNGSAWINTIMSTTESFHGLWASSGGTAYAVGTNAKIMYTTGTMWYGMTPPAGIPAATLYAVWGTSDDDIWAVGSDAGSAVVIHFDGGSWSIQAEDFAPALQRLWGSSSTDIYATASDYTLWHYDGATWSQIDDPAIGYARSVHGTGQDDVYVLSNGRVVRFDGAAWQAMVFPVPRNYNDIWVAPDGTIFLVGSSGAAGLGER